MSRGFCPSNCRILENTLPLNLYPSKEAALEYLNERMDRKKDYFRFEKIRRDIEVLDFNASDTKDWDMYGKYMLESRINVNIRKVNL